jgi:hypothetical protein
MRQFIKHAHRRRWLPMTACVLVFLFAFHAKTSGYGRDLRVKPHTATSSKLWKKNPNALTPPAPTSFLAGSQSFDFRNLSSGRVSLQFQLAPGFVPVVSFSGLSPPLII